MYLLQQNICFKYKYALRSVTTLKPILRNISIESYNFLQKSKIPTMHFQKSLPRLPVPVLEKTCERYLTALRPILSDDAFKTTQSTVSDFQKGVGKKLHEQLLQQNKNNKHTSYISEPWFDMYLRDRKPLPINYNPFLIFEDHPKLEYNNQLVKATNMIIDSLRFMNSLRKDILKPEVFHMNPKKSDTELFRTVTSLLPSAVSWYGAYMFNAYPLDMSQYYNLFNSTRIPELDKDRIYQDTTKKHVLVMRKGNFYIFDVFETDGTILHPNKIMACLDYILKDATTPPAEFPIGILTTENRDVWSVARRHLLEAGNEKVLKLIDSALFNVCLDEEEMNKDTLTMVHQFLHGNGKNRWFDKSFSLLFTKDGVGGINFEHAWGDGVAVLRYFQDIYKESVDNPHVHPDSKPYTTDISEKVTKLKINYNDKIKSDVTTALKKYEAFCDSLAIDYILTDGIGKNLCKKHSISPDAVMQLGFQSAFYKQAGEFVGSYESCSTAAFKHGRTETIRPCTADTKAYSIAVNNNAKPSGKLYEMVKQCSKTHGQLTKEAAMGQGFDRHLFALKHIAEKRGNKLASLYTDPAYAKINYNIISTSTLSSPAVYAGGFGPVVKDGYGIGYMIRDDSLGTLVTSYPEHRNGADYIECLKKSYDQIKNILNSNKQ